MSQTTETIRDKVRAIADELPVDASWDDVIEEARFRKAVDSGVAAAERGSFATEDEVRNAFARWGVKV
jgi:predicted transcriptional regulator